MNSFIRLSKYWGIELVCRWQHKSKYCTPGESMKARIIERTGPDGRKSYVIQQKHFLFRWWWVDAWMNSMDGASCRDDFPTLEEAQKHLCYFDGTPVSEKVISCKE